MVGGGTAVVGTAVGLVVADFVGVAVGVRVGVGEMPGLGLAWGGVAVLVGVTVAVGVRAGCWVAVAGCRVTVAATVGVAVPPPFVSFCREITNAAAIPRPSAASTTPTATRIAAPLAPCDRPAGGGVRRILDVVWRLCNCGGRPGAAATGDGGVAPGVAGTRVNAVPNAVAVA